MEESRARLSSFPSTGEWIRQDMFTLRNRTRCDSFDAAFSNAYSSISSIRFEASGRASDVLMGNRGGGDGNGRRQGGRNIGRR